LNNIHSRIRLAGFMIHGHWANENQNCKRCHGYTRARIWSWIDSSQWLRAQPLPYCCTKAFQQIMCQIT
jgi:hypothetical protein